MYITFQRTPCVSVVLQGAFCSPCVLFQFWALFIVGQSLTEQERVVKLCWHVSQSINTSCSLKGPSGPNPSAPQPLGYCCALFLHGHARTSEHLLFRLGLRAALNLTYSASIDPVWIFPPLEWPRFDRENTISTQRSGVRPAGIIIPHVVKNRSEFMWGLKGRMWSLMSSQCDGPVLCPPSLSFSFPSLV